MSPTSDKSNFLERIGGKLRRFYLNRFISTLTLPYRSKFESDPFHQVFQKFCRQTESLKNAKVLEIGSRSLSGTKKVPHIKECAEFVGFDIHPGEGVDVVGDIHELSSHFEANHFDSVYLVSVLEHVAMPWKAVLEINKVMKPGGLLFISTHPTWPAHELPWDFWRFSKAAFEALFNPTTGFALIECVEGLPCAVIPLVSHGSLDALPSETAYLGIGALARKTGDPDPRIHWDVSLKEILATAYPLPGSSPEGLHSPLKA